MVESAAKLEGTGFSVNCPKLVVDACRLMTRDVLFDGEIRDVERRKEEADGLGKGVDAENPVVWPSGGRISCSICDNQLQLHVGPEKSTETRALSSQVLSYSRTISRSPDCQ